MATPTNDSYSVASGGVIAAGRFTMSATPAWLASAPVGQWSTIAGSALGSSSALYAWPGTVPGTQASLVDAWGGWAVDYDTNRLWVQGGGHSDYGGNEIYKIDLKADAPRWSLARAPTPLAQMTGYIDTNQHSKWNSDGTPVASHIYWNAQYINGKILRSGFFSDFGSALSGRLAFVPNNEAYLHGFDTVSGTWDAYNAHALIPNYQSSDISSGGIGYGPVVTDGTYYYAVMLNRSVMQTQLVRYDPVANTWTGIGPDQGAYIVAWASGSFLGSIYDSSRNEMVVIGEQTDTFVRRFNLATGVVTNSTKTGIAFATASAWDSSYTGICYDSKRDKYYMYSGKAVTDKLLYQCDPASSYAISTVAGTGTPSATTGPAGINSRFKYFPEYDCIIMQPTHADPLYVLRLS